MLFWRKKKSGFKRRVVGFRNENGIIEFTYDKKKYYPVSNLKGLDIVRKAVGNYLVPTFLGDSLEGMLAFSREVSKYSHAELKMQNFIIGLNRVCCGVRGNSIDVLVEENGFWIFKTYYAIFFEKWDSDYFSKFKKGVGKKRC